MAHFAASWTRLDTAACPENAPKNHLQIHQVLVEVFLFRFLCFCHYANLISKLAFYFFTFQGFSAFSRFHKKSKVRK